MICYLDRGPWRRDPPRAHAAAGRRENPVAIIRVPRERDGRQRHRVVARARSRTPSARRCSILMNSLRPLLQALQRKGGAEQMAWTICERCISEIIADFWAVAKVGRLATTGLDRRGESAARVRLPHQYGRSASISRGFACGSAPAMGRALYPHPQWARLEQMWDAFYPLAGLDLSAGGSSHLCSRRCRHLSR